MNLRFLFVDRITAIDESVIKGQYFATSLNTLSTCTNTGRLRLGLVSEAIDQLASWYSIGKTHFSYRPVFIMASSIELITEVLCDQWIDLRAQVLHLDEQRMIFDGSAWRQGQKIVSMEQVQTFQYPLSELEDPKITRLRFDTISDRDLGEDASFAIQDRPPSADLTDFLELHCLDKTRGNYLCRILPGAFFYNDHFPRRPMTPIVVINEIISYLCTQNGRVLTSGRRLFQVSHLKIKEPWFPDEIIEIRLGMDSSSHFQNDPLIQMVSVFMDQQKIMSGRYHFTATPEQKGERKGGPLNEG